MGRASPQQVSITPFRFVSVKTVAGTFVNDNNATKDVGQDAAVTVNGASAQSNGLSVSYRSSNLDIEFDLDSTFNKTGTGSFEITGGGATFSLGSKVTETDKASVGISSVSTGSLGNNSLGYLSALASGGPARYDGKDIKSTHAGMHISNPEFDAVIGDLKASLDKLQIPNKEQKELLAIIESTRPEIVTQR